MAKWKRKDDALPAAPDAEDRRRWQAESMVENAIKDTPQYRKAIKATTAQLKQVEQHARAALRRKS